MMDCLPGVNGETTLAQRKAHNLKVAVYYARRGVPVMPLRDKRPMTLLYPERDIDITAERREASRAEFVKKHGFEPLGIGSSTDEATIRGWWTGTGAELAVGISPGLVGAIVVDCDNKEGDNADATLLRALLAEHGLALDPAEVPITLSGRREGRHAWFANPEGLGCGKAGAIKADWKGVGGQVVAPGCLLPPAEDGDGKPRHYQPTPGGLDIVAAIGGGLLPEMPACLRALHTNGARIKGLSDFPETEAEIEAGPEVEPDAAEVAALIVDMRDPVRGIGELWDRPDIDTSTNRWRLAKALRSRKGDRAVDVHRFVALVSEWEGAGSLEDGGGSGTYTARHLAKEWEKNRHATIPSTGGAFGAAVDEDDDAPQVDPYRAHLDEVVFGSDAAAARTEAALVAAVSGDGLTKGARGRLDTLLDAIRGGGTVPLPGSFDEFRAKVEQAKPEKPAKPRMRRLLDIVARELPPVEYVIHGIMTAGEFVISAGAPNAGKSVDKMHMALCVANGTPYHGHRTRKAGVLFVGAENASEDERRILANMKRHGAVTDGGLTRDPSAPFFHRAALAQFYSADGAVTADERNIIADALQIERDTGHRCKLIVFDNLRRLIAGGSTNDETDVTRVVQALDRIREATGAAIDVIAHTIRDGTRYAGSGSIESSADSLWHYTGPAKGKPGEIAFHKMRLGDKSRTLAYAFTSEVVAHDTDGEPVRTVVAVDEVPTAAKAVDGSAFGDVSKQEDASGGASPKQAEDGAPEDTARRAMVLDIVGGLTAASPAKGCSLPTVLDDLNARRRKGRKEPIHEKTLRRLVADMIADGKLARHGGTSQSRIGLPPKGASEG